jgi:uncharacterized protein YbaP (TraB family)
MKRICFFLLFIFISVAGVFAQKPDAATLLWRISGNGLEKPSYLMGTMHVRDENLFYFGDSVYAAIEKVQLFATEIEDDVFLEYQAKKIIRESLKDANEEENNGEELPDAIPLTDGKNKKLQASDEKLKIRDYIGLLQSGLKKKKTGNRKLMPFIIDGYLNNIARDQGKIITGLEDPEDFEGWTEENNTNISPANLIKLNNGTMESYYVKGEIQKIENLMQQLYSKETLHFLLWKRNLKMASRIDSLVQRYTGFFAVGAGHLAGDSGLIRILLQKGYTVDPVFSKNKMPYRVFDIKKETWFNTYSANSAYMVEMPKKTNRTYFNELEGVLHFTQDIGTRVSYFLMEIVHPQQPEPVAEKNAMKKLLEEKGYTILETRNIKGDPNYEFSCTMDDFIYRIKGFRDQAVYYFLIAGTGSDEERFLNEPDVERFFHSVRKNPAYHESPVWEKLSRNEFAFHCILPAHSMFYYKNYAGNSNASLSVVASDPVTMNTYKIIVYKTNPGYFYAKDSSFFNEYYHSLVTANNNLAKVDSCSLTVALHPAMAFRVIKNNQIISQHLIAAAGNKLYYLSAFKGSDTSGFARFFNHFQIENIQQPNWKIQQLPGDLLQVFAPGPFKEEAGYADQESEKTGTATTYFLSYDSGSAMNYYVYKKKINPFVTYKNDSIFFEENIREILVAGDSIIHKTTARTDGRMVVEIRVQKESSFNQVGRYRFMTNGDALYGFNATGIPYFIDSGKTDSFFNRYRFPFFAKSTYTEEKTPYLKKALESGDYHQLVAAQTSIGKITVNSQNRQLIYSMLLQTYRSDTSSYQFTHKQLVRLVVANPDSSVIPFIAKNYGSIKNDTIQSGLLFILSAFKTDDSYQLLRKLLNQPLPKSLGEYDLEYQLTDSIRFTAKHLAQTLPGLLLRISEPMLIVAVLDKMIDSQLITEKVYVPYATTIISTAKKILNTYQHDTESFELYMDELLHALGCLHTTESNKLLDAFARLKDDHIQYGVLKAQIRTGNSLNKKLLQQLCANDYYRADLYDLLLQYKLEKSFIKQYATAEQMAKSHLFNYITGFLESGVSDIKFYKRHTVKSGGEDQYFYFFKVMLDEENAYRISWCGPFAKTDGNPVFKKDYSAYINMDEFINNLDPDKEFKTWHLENFPPDRVK